MYDKFTGDGCAVGHEERVYYLKTPVNFVLRLLYYSS